MEMEYQDDQRSSTKGIFARSVETEELIRWLRDIPIGELIPYQDIEAKMRSPLAQIRSNVLSARRALARERIFFETVRREGIRRIGDEAWIDRGTNARQRVARLASRTRREMSYVVYENLSNAKKAQLNLEMTALGLAEAMRRPKVVESFRAICTAEERRLTLAESASALRDMMRKS